ncbi:hypothetical protein LCGC14_1911360, partial [marine sediment metagenome]
MNVSGKRRSNTREILCALLPIITWL